MTETPLQQIKFQCENNIYYFQNIIPENEYTRKFFKDLGINECFNSENKFGIYNNTEDLNKTKELVGYFEFQSQGVNSINMKYEISNEKIASVQTQADLLKDICNFLLTVQQSKVFLNIYRKNNYPSLQRFSNMIKGTITYLKEITDKLSCAQLFSSKNLICLTVSRAEFYSQYPYLEYQTFVEIELGDPSVELQDSDSTKEQKNTCIKL